MSERIVTGNPEKIREFLSEPECGPFTMINLVRFRDIAGYPDDSPNAGISGRDAYKLYSTELLPIISELGAEMTWSAKPIGHLMVPSDIEWDRIFHITWPSRAAFTAMVTNPEYREISTHRTAALIDSRLIAVQED